MVIAVTVNGVSSSCLLKLRPRGTEVAGINCHVTFSVKETKVGTAMACRKYPDTVHVGGRTLELAAGSLDYARKL